MTLKMTPAQAELWQRGWWEAYAVEMDMVEEVDAQQIAEPVAVCLPDGSVAFGITPPPRSRRWAC